jgi:hypothetical protein
MSRGFSFVGLQIEEYSIPNPQCAVEDLSFEYANTSHPLPIYQSELGRMDRFVSHRAAGQQQKRPDLSQFPINRA